MNTLTHIIAALATVTLASSSIVKTPSIDSDDTFELLILHNNDMHARFEQTSQLSGLCTTADREAGKCYGGFPRVAHVVKEAREAAAAGTGPPVLYLNAGDTYTGTAWFTIYKWKIAAEFINALQPDAVSLGNHEFDEGVPGLTPFIENLSCPVLAANLAIGKVPALLVEPNLRRSVIFDIQGVRVGVIGYLTPDTKFLAIKNDVEYIDEIVAIKKEVEKLKLEGISIFIALGHSGFKKDLQIAQEVDDIDVVIGGHTNTFLWNGTSPDVEEPVGPYPTFVKQSSGRLVPVVQAYAYTKYLGKLYLTIDNAGEILKVNGTPILLDNSVPQDPDVLLIVEKYRQGVTNISERIIGNISVALNGYDCRKVECNLGNMIADAMIHMYASEYKGEGWTDAPVAIIQGGGIRTSIDHPNLPANVTMGDLIAVMPFAGNLTKVKINGSNVLKMLERSVEKYNPSYAPGQFLQVSGLMVEYDLKMPPNKRVIKVSIRCGMCNVPRYFDLNKTEDYYILMPSFLSNGGDGYTVLETLPYTNLDYGELEASVAYMQSRSPVHPGIENRIIIHNLNTNSASALSPVVFGIVAIFVTTMNSVIL